MCKSCFKWPVFICWPVNVVLSSIFHSLAVEQVRGCVRMWFFIHWGHSVMSADISDDPAWEKECCWHGMDRGQECWEMTCHNPQQELVSPTVSSAENESGMEKHRPVDYSTNSTTFHISLMIEPSLPALSFPETCRAAFVHPHRTSLMCWGHPWRWLVFSFLHALILPLPISLPSPQTYCSCPSSASSAVLWLIL